VLPRRRRQPVGAAHAVQPQQRLARQVEQDAAVVVVQQRARAGRQELAAAVEGPARLGEQLAQVRVRFGELVVDGPGGGEEVAAARGGVLAGLEGEDVGEGVGVEGLGGGLVS
jgi:hypothetical protein